MPMYNNPRVSIITVCYNSANTIERAMVSVLEQAYENLEYIIIDGGSTDKTVDIIKKYEGHLAYWCSEQDFGIYDAMNKGIGKATGEFLAFLNSDDYYYSPDSIQLLVSFFEKNKDADIIAGRIALINSYGIRYGYSPVPDRLEDISFRMVLDHPAMLVRRALFLQDGNFNLKYKIAADYEWVLREYCKGRKIVPVPTVVTAFRVGGASSEISYELAEEVYQIALYGNLPEMLNEYKFKIEDKYQWTKQWIGNKLRQERELEAHFKEVQHEISSLIGTGNICIWGYGLRGQECHELLGKLGCAVSLIIDIDESKWQNTGKIRVMGVDGLMDFCGTVIISAVNYELQIRKQIKDMDLKEITTVCYSDMLSVINEYIF